MPVFNFPTYNANQNTAPANWASSYARGRAMTTAFRQEEMKTKGMEIDLAAKPGQMERAKQTEELAISNEKQRQTGLQQKMDEWPIDEKIRKLNLRTAGLRANIAEQGVVDNFLKGLLALPPDMIQTEWKEGGAYGKMVGLIGQEAADRLGFTKDGIRLERLIQLQKRSGVLGDNLISQNRDKISQLRANAELYTAIGADGKAADSNKQADDIENDLKARLDNDPSVAARRANDWTDLKRIADSGVKRENLSPDQMALVDQLYGGLSAGMQKTARENYNELLGLKAPEGGSQKQKAKAADRAERARTSLLNGEKAYDLTLEGAGGLEGSVRTVVEVVTGTMYEFSTGNELPTGPAEQYEILTNFIKARSYAELVAPGPISKYDWENLKKMVGQSPFRTKASARAALTTINRMNSKVVVAGYDGNPDQRQAITDSFSQIQNGEAPAIPGDVAASWLRWNETTGAQALEMNLPEGTRFLHPNGKVTTVTKTKQRAVTPPRGGQISQQPVEKTGFITDGEASPAELQGRSLMRESYRVYPVDAGFGGFTDKNEFRRAEWMREAQGKKRYASRPDGEPPVPARYDNSIVDSR